MSHILIFGDSITLGAWDKKGGWAQRLNTFLVEKALATQNFWNTDFITTYNLGIDSIAGENSMSLLERFESETKRRLSETETKFIFAIGKNDSSFIKDKKTFLIPPKIFVKNIQKLINLSKKYSSKIIFIGTAMVDESKTAPIHWNKNMYYKNEYLNQYNEIIKLTCKKNKIHFIEILKEFKKENYKNLLEDGLHPNTDGHKKIFEIIKSYLEKHKII